MTKVVMIHGNPLNPDSRLEKEAKALVDGGYDVSLLGWNRWDSIPSFEIRNGYSISRFPLHAPKDIGVIFFWPLWWIYEFVWLLFHKWDVVHAADFDSYFPALIIAKLKRKHIVYDIFDFLPDSHKLPALIHSIFTYIDLFLMKFADYVIIVDKHRLKQIHRENNPEGVEFIYNTPNDVDIARYSSDESSIKFKIFYGGVIIPERDIIGMLRIVSEREDILMTVAGWGNQALVSDVKSFASKYPNIFYMGGVSYEEIISCSLNADILFALYDPSVPNNKYSSPNKLFEAMMCGKPIIVNDNTTMADTVREECCGIVVPFGDKDALENAVLTLKNNPELRKELGENGRRAYETKYNWKIMEKRLLDLYASLEKEQ